MGTTTNNAANATPVWLAPAPGSTAKNIIANASTLLKTGAGVLTSLNVNTVGTTSTAKIYDGLDNTGILLGTFDTTKQGLALNTPWNFTVGLCIVTAGVAAADITANYL